MSSLRRGRPGVRVGAPDPSLTAVSGMAAITELGDQLDVIEALDTAIGPIKACAADRGVGSSGCHLHLLVHPHESRRVHTG